MTHVPDAGARPSTTFNATVVGAGPNGLAAAIFLARAGLSVCVLEANPTIGGGARTMELTLPGFKHDICSAIHPLGVASPFFRQLPLGDHGLEFVHPDLPLAHPLNSGASYLARSVSATAEALDAPKYEALMNPLVDRPEALLNFLLAPPRWPRHPVQVARFGIRALRSARALGRVLNSPAAQALVAGTAAHSMLRLDQLATAGFALTLMMLGHSSGWPFPRGGSQSIAGALGGYAEALGADIRVGHPVRSWSDVPRSKTVLFDVTPRQLLAICGERFSRRYRRALERFRYGPGVFKLDIALDGPVPWMAPECSKAGTVHIGGSFDEIADAEATVTRGYVPDAPFVLVAQPSLFDDSRAPAGKHALWAYCHVPSGYSGDMTEAIESQIERFAPGFRDLILARSALGPAGLEAANNNHVGGDINGGIQDLRGHLFRPVAKLDPYSTSAPDIFLCSSSTPPGGGVHGMCGYHAARSALRYLRRHP